MISKQLTISGFPAQLIISVAAQETTFDLTVHPFISGLHSPSVELVIKREHCSDSATYDSVFKGSNTEFSSARAAAYLKACGVALDQCQHWQSVAESLNDNTDATARELVRMAQENRWDDVLIHAALIGYPFAELSNTGYNRNKHPDHQCSNLASVFFRDPAFGIAKETFLQYVTSGEHWDIKELPDHAQLYIRIMLTILYKIPMCENGRDDNRAIAALLLERDSNASTSKKAFMERYEPVFHGADGQPTSYTDYRAELLKTRPAFSDTTA